MKKKVRSIFISDLHLGCNYCKAKQLIPFLKNYQAEYLYLVGDIIDFWKFKNGFYWDDDCSYVIRKIIGMAKNDNTKVTYVIGNHDEALREIAPWETERFTLINEIVHITATGQRFLVIHGDEFDAVTINWKIMYYLGDNAYSAVMWLNKWINIFRRKLGFRYWSFSAMLKRNVKKAVNFINSFEHYIAKHTKEKGCHGVICGHIHTPVIKEIEGVQYYNCGDWQESCTAIIEHLDGEMELIYASQD